MPRFRDIPQLTTWSSAYQVDVSLDYLKEHLQKYLSEYGLEMEPDFQRGHVWTETQQIAFVEFLLRGGVSGRTILFNCPNWNKVEMPKDFVLVDGLQRLTAVMRFLNDDMPVFGHRLSEYEDRLRMLGVTLKIVVNDLPTRAAVLRWYLELNAGGTPHSPEEIARVRGLLEAEGAGG